MDDPIQIFGYAEKAINALKAAIEDIVSRHSEETEIMLVGRNNFDLTILMERDTDKSFIWGSGTTSHKIKYKKYPSIRFSFTSAHRSKGLEAENVIVINLRNHLVGFPNKIADDPLLDLVLTKGNSYEYEEERRLFYVALTRTKNKTYLLAPQKEPSIFVEELVRSHNILFNLVTGEESIRQNPRCTVCKTGLLVIRENRAEGNRFVGCSNYPQCKTTFNETSILKDPVKCMSCEGYMVKRRGKWGEFYGCRNYPMYNSTLQIK